MQRYILESRAIRLDQDQEYEESLRADEEKVNSYHLRTLQII